MALDKIIELVNGKPPAELEHEKEVLLDFLRDLGIKEPSRYGLLERIFQVAYMSSNHRTRESFLRSYFRSYKYGIDKDGRDSSIIIEITKKCNKRCEHCYSNSPGQRKGMRDDVLESIIDFARHNYKHIFLTGGEPTLDRRVLNLSEANNDIVFFMFTNGSLITPDYAQKLASLGNIIPLLSIDGNSEEAHDSLKGKGSYREVMSTIDLLNDARVPWGFISIVTNKNAEDVLSPEFIKEKKEKGAIIARYLEFLPVGPKAMRDMILSGENYYFMEKRKREIINNREIYMQDTVQDKCGGVLFFDIEGNIKNCAFFHYAKHKVGDGNLSEAIQDTLKDWCSADYVGECPIYSDPKRFKDQLEGRGWKHVVPFPEEYLTNPEVIHQIRANYRRFLTLKAVRGLK